MRASVARRTMMPIGHSGRLPPPEPALVWSLCGGTSCSVRSDGIGRIGGRPTAPSTRPRPELDRFGICRPVSPLSPGPVGICSGWLEVAALGHRWLGRRIPREEPPAAAAPAGGTKGRATQTNTGRTHTHRHRSEAPPATDRHEATDARAEPAVHFDRLKTP